MSAVKYDGRNIRCHAVSERRARTFDPDQLAWYENTREVEKGTSFASESEAAAAVAMLNARLEALGETERIKMTKRAIREVPVTNAAFAAALVHGPRFTGEFVLHFSYLGYEHPLYRECLGVIEHAITEAEAVAANVALAQESVAQIAELQELANSIGGTCEVRDGDIIIYATDGWYNRKVFTPDKEGIADAKATLLEERERKSQLESAEKEQLSWEYDNARIQQWVGHWRRLLEPYGLAKALSFSKRSHETPNGEISWRDEKFAFGDTTELEATFNRAQIGVARERAYARAVELAVEAMAQSTDQSELQRRGENLAELNRQFAVFEPAAPPERVSDYDGC